MKKAAYYSLWIGLPMLSTLFQAGAKLLAAQMRGTDLGWNWLGQAIQSPWGIVVVGSEALSFFLWLNILTIVPLSKAFPITGTAYVSVVLTSWTIFHEKVAPLQILGSALILAGVWLISTASQDDISAPAIDPRRI